MVLNSSDILSDLGQFIQNLLDDLASGLIFFGGPFDIFVAVLDILATALVVYYVLKILRDSRAWQLLKGLALIIGFALVCSLTGLTTVGFLLNNTISVFAIAFVVIFQPELRRALETFGRSSFSMISSAIATEDVEVSTRSIHHLIESIVRACEKMSANQTGALIILERQTKLSDLIEQENVVVLDAAVSATMLQQIFYKNSPLHDGAVIIRDGRISAARVHVPLSDNYHLRKDYGTRHRAAIGASEIGDTIAIVVSEERGSIGLTLEGRLYILDNADALRTLLHKLLSPAKHGVTWGGLFRSRNKDADSAQPSRHASGAAVSREAVGREASERDPGQDDYAPPASDSRDRAERYPPEAPAGARVKRSRFRLLPQILRRSTTANRMPRLQRVMLTLASLAIAIIVWLYVQVTVNPVDTRSFTVQLAYRGIETAQNNGFELQVPLESIQVTLMGRRKTIVNLQTADINAYIDFSDVSETGLIPIPVEIDTTGLLYTRATYISPASITVSVRRQ